MYHILVSHSTTILRVSTESETATSSRPARAMFPSLLCNRLAPMVARDATGAVSRDLRAEARMVHLGGARMDGLVSL